MSNSTLDHFAHYLNFKEFILFLHQRIMLKMNVEKSADDTLDVEEFDHVGDVVLIVEDKSQNIAKFLVSSKVLALASPVFAALFSQNFSEGGRIIEGDRPEITLRDDDPAVMRQILGILHYWDPGDEINAEMLSALAIHCDKYTCTGALRSWIKNWFTSIGPAKSVDDYGFLLLAAHFFRMPDSFASVSSKAQRDLTPDVLLTWEVHEHLNLLPRGVISVY